ncbi:variable large family protein (plasmid) [Borrelia miyamotoi]|uniref:Variable large protein n=4 Tax=Borrelia miyamotoi TaxID=47466 RepID=A0AAX3JPH1_9SPIR|nr:variable large family protein [Borrelia miyamotoi]ATQ16729.1 variable large family protein [Borrelia miyamotoi]ATQ19023.1 variable large family protein [Borrelia miyamotoi]WAZ72594.1 variable large family protein [Borrelia miyamotoi]WDS49321.1 variable large family protein [Borrelia miyamotoi]WEG99724.1 variable large family protein [Borrelia miyamotoi]
MEKRSEIKNILIIMMIVLLMIGCGQQKEGKSSVGGVSGSGLSGAMMEVGRSAENVFYAFMELLSDVLGFTAKTTTKKNDVGSYFNSLGVKLGEASKELEEVAKKAETGIDKNYSSKNLIKEAVEVTKGVLATLKGHLESLGQVGDSNLVGDAATDDKGVTAGTDALKGAFKALKGIIDIAEGAGVAKPKAGSTAVKLSNADNKDGAKILATDNKAGVNDVGKAAVILASVSGEEILASIVESTENKAVKVSTNVTASTTPLEFALGGNGAHLAQDAALASAVSGGIALRSLVKDGKLASGAADGSAGGKEEVQKVGITAANKLLGAVEDIIKKTVKNILEKAKTKIDEARNSKTAE